MPSIHGQQTCQCVVSTDRLTVRIDVGLDFLILEHQYRWVARPLTVVLRVHRYFRQYTRLYLPFRIIGVRQKLFRDHIISAVHAQILCRNIDNELWSCISCDSQKYRCPLLALEKQCYRTVIPTSIRPLVILMHSGTDSIDFV